MELTQKQSLEFKESVRSSLTANASQSWLNSLQLLKITPAKVVIEGIPHKVYLYEIKTNHEISINIFYLKNFSLRFTNIHFNSVRLAL